jgi:hypothetical protein
MAVHTHVMWGINNRPVGGHSSKISFHSINMNKKKIGGTKISWLFADYSFTDTQI